MSSSEELSPSAAEIITTPTKVETEQVFPNFSWKDGTKLRSGRFKAGKQVGEWIWISHQ